MKTILFKNFQQMLADADQNQQKVIAFQNCNFPEHIDRIYFEKFKHLKEIQFMRCEFKQGFMVQCRSHESVRILFSACSINGMVRVSSKVKKAPLSINFFNLGNALNQVDTIDIGGYVDTIMLEGILASEVRINVKNPNKLLSLAFTKITLSYRMRCLVSNKDNVKIYRCSRNFLDVINTFFPGHSVEEINFTKE